MGLVEPPEQRQKLSNSWGSSFQYRNGHWEKQVYETTKQERSCWHGWLRPLCVTSCHARASMTCLGTFHHPDKSTKEPKEFRPPMTPFSSTFSSQHSMGKWATKPESSIWASKQKRVQHNKNRSWARAPTLLCWRHLQSRCSPLRYLYVLQPSAALDQLEADITWCPLVIGVVTSHGAPEVRSFFDVGDWRSFNPADFPCPLWHCGAPEHSWTFWIPAPGEARGLKASRILYAYKK